MAAAFGSFSIREYASKMRTLDVLKSWPFGGESDEVKKETPEAFLPPITVTKFRWWSDELELLRSKSDEANQEPDLEMKTDGNKSTSGKVGGENINASDEEKEKFEKVCPVCRVFAASTVNAVNAHIDGCLAQASTVEQWQMKKESSKTKSRVPKKRSIAEIFAVAPPIEAIATAKHENDEGKYGDCLKQGKIDKSKVSKSRGLVSAIETIKNRKKMKKKMKKNRILPENSAPISIRLNKYKKNFNDGELENMTTIKEAGNQIHLQENYDENGRASDILDHVSLTQKKHKLVEHGELNSRKKMPVASCRSILKNKVKVTLEVDSPNCSLREERHVRFLDKEVIIGSESFAAPKEKEKTMEGSKEVAQFEASTDVECTTRNRLDCQDGDKFLNFLRNSAEKSTPKNRVVNQDQGYPTLSHKTAYSGSPGSAEEEQYKICEKTQVHSNVSSRAFDSYTQLIDRLVVPLNPVGKSSSFSIPSSLSAFSENADKRFSNPPSSEAMAGSRRHFPDWQQQSMENEFFGLPLNSQGELIHLSSGTTNGFNQVMESRSIATSSRSFHSRNLSEYRTENQTRDLFPSRSNVNGSQDMHIPVGVDELDGTRRAEIQWLNFKNGSNQPVNPLPLDISFNGCRYFGEVQSQREFHEHSNSTRQTMRLMGKDVAVGRSSKQIQAPDDANFWRNSENMTRFNPSDNRVFFQDQFRQARSSETPKLWSQNNPTFQQPYVSGSGPLTIGENSCGGMYDSARLSYQSNSALGFPFLRSDYEEHAQSPCFQVSKSFPPWMLPCKEQEKAPCSSSRILTGMNWNSFSHNSPGNIILNTPSTNHFPQFVPVIHGAKPTSAFNTLNVKDSEFCKKSNKKPVYGRKPPKITISCHENEARHDLGRIPTIDCPNIDSMARAGPVLKSSQSMDHDHYEPINSTIPFVGFSSSVSLPQSQKMTEIYSV